MKLLSVSIYEKKIDRAEPDTSQYACPYGLTRDKLRYTPFNVDPKEVHGETYPRVEEEGSLAVWRRVRY